MTEPADLSLVFLKTNPAAAGQVLEDLAPEDVAGFAEAIPDDTMASVVGHMETGNAARILVACTPTTAAQVLVRTVPHVRAAILRALPNDTKDQVLSAVSKREAAVLRRYLAYDPATVGAWMSAPKTTIRHNSTVEKSLQRLRRLRDTPGVRLFVTDADRTLAGAVDVDALVVAGDSQQISEIMHPNVDALSPNATLAETIKLDDWDRTLVMPVTDRSDRLLGTLTFDALREGLLAQREDSETEQPQLSAMVLHIGEALLVSAAGLTRTAVAPSAGRRVDGVPS